MKKDIEKVVGYLKEFKEDNYENEDNFLDIAYSYICKDDKEFKESLMDLITSDEALLLLSLLSDIASNKGYVINNNEVSSFLFSIPIVAVQTENNDTSTLLCEDQDAIKHILYETGIPKDCEIIIHDQFLTPANTPKEAFDINKFHDGLVSNIMKKKHSKMDNASNFFFNNRQENIDNFDVSNPTFSYRNLVFSVLEKGEFNNEEPDSFFNVSKIDVIDTDRFCIDLNNKVLQKYFDQTLVVFAPMPYLDGFEEGLIGYNSIVLKHFFSPLIDSYGTETLKIVLDSSETGVLNVLLIDKASQTVLTNMQWVVPLLTENSIDSNVDYLKDMCENLGFEGYEIGRQSDFKQRVLN